MKNMSMTDRIVRAIVGIGLLILAFIVVTGVLQIIFWIFAAILLVTALVGVCPAYMLFHFSTKKGK
jgi:phosphate/sulfate permease